MRILQEKIKVNYDVLMELERGMSSKDVKRNFNVAKNAVST